MGEYMGTATRAMAVGKNKRLTKGKKGSKKKAIDPFTKKDWYDVKAPALFTNTNVGKTLVTRTAGTKIASEGLKGRVFEVSLGDLNKSEDDSFRKIRLRVEKFVPEYIGKDIQKACEGIYPLQNVFIRKVK